MPACEELHFRAAVDEGTCEVVQQLVLPPSTTWEIAAREVNSAGMMGTSTIVRLQVPSHAEYEQAASSAATSSCVAARRAAPSEPAGERAAPPPAALHLPLGSCAAGVSEEEAFCQYFQISTARSQGDAEEQPTALSPTAFEDTGLDERSSNISAHDVDSRNSTDADDDEASHLGNLERRARAKTCAADWLEKASDANGQRDPVSSVSLAINVLNMADREKVSAPLLTARGRLQSCAEDLDSLDTKEQNVLLTARERLRPRASWSTRDPRRRVTIGAPCARDKELQPYGLPPLWAVQYR